MTKLTKTATFEFDPGSPFIPATFETTCTGQPTPPTPPPTAPALPGGATGTGGPGQFPSYRPMRSSDGTISMVPYCISGSLNTTTGRCR